MTPDDFSAIALWAVPAGLIGARLYHVITDWRRFEGHWLDAVKLWQGGLGIPGGLVAGVGVGLWVAHRRGLSLADAADVAAPALPLAQAIGRWGNWWNQELFGRPTSLPWGLEIDRAHRPARYIDVADLPSDLPLREPLEPRVVRGPRRGRSALGDGVGAAAPQRGQLFFLYVLGYGVGRLWVEALRSDEASHLGPLRVNIWVSLVAIAGGVVGLVVQGRRGRRRQPGSPSPELGDDGVVEGGPGLDRPGPEAGVGEHDAAGAGDRIDPAEGPSSSEVAERPG